MLTVFAFFLGMAVGGLIQWLRTSLDKRRFSPARDEEPLAVLRQRRQIEQFLRFDGYDRT